MPSICITLALSVGAGKEEKVRIFREETSLRGKNLEDDTERKDSGAYTGPVV